MRQLIKRLGKRLYRRGEKPAGFEPIWTDVEPYVKEALQSISAAFVASWEVATSTLYRVGTEKWPAEEVAQLVNRFSDGLVPTLDGLSTVEHQLAITWKQGANQGNQLTGRLPLVRELFASLGPKTAAGWLKTIAYLQPIFTRLELEQEVIDELQQLGQILEQSLNENVSAFILKLEQLPEGQHLQRDILRVVQEFREASSRSIEIELDAVGKFIQGRN